MGMSISEQAEVLVSAVADAAAAGIREARGDQQPPEDGPAGGERPVVYRTLSAWLSDAGQAAVECDPTGVLRRHAPSVLAAILAGSLMSASEQRSREDTSEDGLDSTLGIRVLACAASMVAQAAWPAGADGEALKTAIEQAAVEQSA